MKKINNHYCNIISIILAFFVSIAGCSSENTEIKQLESKETIENNNARYDELFNLILDEKYKENEIDTIKIIELYEEQYQYASSLYQKIEVKGNIINLYEQMGDYAKSLQLLDEYEDKFGESKATLIHRAVLYWKQASQLESEGKMSMAYDCCNQTAALLQKSLFLVNTPPNSEDISLKKHSDSEITKAFSDYFFNYYCDIYANRLLGILITDTTFLAQNTEYFFGLAPEFEKILNSYYDYNTNKTKYSLIASPPSEINQLSTLHLGIEDKYWSLGAFLDEINHARWWCINTYIFVHDRINGYDSTCLKIKRIMEYYPIKGEIYRRFFLDTYIGLNDSIGRKSKIPYEVLLSLFNDAGYDYVTVLSPTTIDGELSSFIKAGITESRILLRCNDWVFSDFEDFTPETVESYKGKTKNIVLLSDDYRVDTIQITTDRLGVTIRNLKVDRAFFSLLLYDFDYYINYAQQ